MKADQTRKRALSGRTFGAASLLVALLPFAAIGAMSADSLATGFADPPRTAGPHAWWHWMNGNVTRDGITRDLESMAANGFGGAVRLPDGAVLAFTRKRDMDCASLLTVRVVDAGTLAVTTGGETIAELGVDEHVVEVPASVGTAEIRCAYAGTGFAEVIRFRSNIGFFMLIR